MSLEYQVEEGRKFPELKAGHGIPEQKHLQMSSIKNRKTHTKVYHDIRILGIKKAKEKNYKAIHSTMTSIARIW